MYGNKKKLEKLIEEYELALQKTNFRKVEAARLIRYDYGCLREKIKKAFKENPGFNEKYPIIRFLYFRNKS